MQAFTHEAEQGRQGESGLSRWVIRLLYAQIFIAAASVASGFFEFRMLRDFANGRYLSRETMLSAAHINDLRQGYLAITSTLVFAIGAIFILRWIYTRNRQASHLKQQAMRFSPAWAVVWYFIPLANLWKPFQAMKELWLTCAQCDGHGKGGSRFNYLPLWWALWLSSGVLGTLAVRLEIHSANVSDLLVANVTGIASDLVSIPLSMVFMALVRDIDHMLAQCHEHDS